MPTAADVSPPQLSDGNTDHYLAGIAKLENKVVLRLSATRLLSEEPPALLNDVENAGGN